MAKTLSQPLAAAALAAATAAPIGAVVVDSWGWGVELVELCGRPFDSFVDGEGREHQCRLGADGRWTISSR